MNRTRQDLQCTVHVWCVAVTFSYSNQGDMGSTPMHGNMFFFQTYSRYRYYTPEEGRAEKCYRHSFRKLF